MIDFGIVKPGTTLYIPFQTFDSNDPSASVTISGLATTDIEIYKNGGTTQRASDAGYSLLDTDGIDFDTITGIHGFSIDLADNTTSEFYQAGNQYWVVVSSITVDAATINFVAATFRIGYPEAILNTSIATLSSQTSFTLDSGPAEDDALNGRQVIIHDVASAVQVGHAVISDYTGSTKTVTLAAGTTFTAAAGDNISVLGLAPLQPTTAGNTLDVTATGAAGIDWGNVENASTSVDLSATSINLCDTITTYTGNTVQTGDAFARLGAAGAGLTAVPWNAAWDAEVQSEVNDALVAYNAVATTDLPTNFADLAIEVTTGVVSADTIRISGDATAADNAELMFDGTGYTDDTAPASRAQVDAIGSASGGAIFITNEADNVDSAIKSISFDGTETSGTNASVNAEDGTYHQITHAANNIDIVYQFDVGGGRTASEITWKGYLSGSNDVATIQAYNGSGWDTLRTITGKAGTTNDTITVPLPLTYTGTGADLGKVFIRFECAAQSAPVLYTDQLLVSAVNIGQSVGYALGAVWLDTTASNTNTESYVDGVADNPVSTIAAALTIAADVGLKRIYVDPGSSFTLGASVDGYEFVGSGYTVALNGQSVSGTIFNGATITGNDDGTNATPTSYFSCVMGNNTLGLHSLKQCGLGGTITLAEAGTIDWLFCSSQVAGTSSPAVDFGALVGNTNLNIRHYSGGMEVQNMGGTGTDNCTIEGNGQLVINANCTGGTVAVRGNFKITDNASGATSVVPTVPTIDQVAQGEAQAGSANTITLASTASSTDGFYDPGEVIIFAGTGAGQARSIIDYNGTTKVAVIDKDWRTNPDATSQYVIRNRPSPLHVNEGQAQAGGASSITLNAAASATDDIYIGQTVFLMGGTGQDQARIITDYNGTTKVATVHRAWDTQPDSTTSYIMHPLPTAGETLVNIETDTQDIQSRLPSALISGRMDSTVSAINDNTTSAANLAASTLGIESGTCEGTPTTTVIQTDLAEATDDHYIGRVVVFTSGAAAGQATDITDYTGSTGTITVTALTTAPSASDTFVIV